MTEARGNHVYRREIRADERSSLSVLASLVRDGSTVLDLGTGSGALGALLTAQKNCQVDGVTYSEDEAVLARPGYRRVEVADLEDPAWVQHFTGAQYDFIICADVLEHLRQPEGTLRLCEGLLAPGGEVLISIPNAGYAGLVAELMHGDFRYRDEGLLDRTHLRFFTRRSVHEFLAAQGWSVLALDTIERSLDQSEFRLPFDRLPPAVVRYLQALPDAGVYQFVLRAAPGRAEGIVLPALTPQAQPLFSAQLYWAEGGDFSETRKLVAPGRIGAAQQTLRFALPAGVTRLRFDPADRPGFLHLHALRLCAGGQAVWRWSAAVDGLAALEGMRQQQLVLQPPWPSGGAMVLLTGDDPWFEVPIPAAVYAAAAGELSFEAEMGWPLSADYLALATRLQPLQDRVDLLRRELDPLRERLTQESALAHGSHAAWLAVQQKLDAAQADLDRATQDVARLTLARDGTLEELQRTVRHRNELLEAWEQARVRAETHEQQLSETLAREASLSREAGSLRHRNTELAIETRRLAHEKLSAQTEAQRLQVEFDQLAQHLHWIENSTVFKATRPVVKAKMALDRWLGRGPAAAAAPVAVAALPQPANPLSPTVDVVVPVYRGLADTVRCIESVLASQCRTPWRLIVLNDASPEPDVTQWLRDIAAREDRITLLENPENLGFVGTVNRGMAVSDAHDVVLLNSDAEVANDWLDRLRHAAYHDARVASVTPFSNNATICSYPRFCEANELPAGWDTASLDRAFAQANPRLVVDVPTGVGFCMYIRRDCLREVGLFDVEEFGKGYGEENDFCRRAADAGWRNLHALDTFVRHAGGVSFGASKSQREIDAVEKLRRLHPTYDGIVHRYVAADPPRVARLRADLVRLRCGGRPVLLSVTHDREGGTLRHVHELAQQLAGLASFLVLTPAPGGQVRLSLAEAGSGLHLQFALPTQWGALLDTLHALGVAHVHYHHLAGHQPMVARLASQLGVGWDFTAHDYHAMCPQISLTDSSDRFCGEEGAGECRRCEPGAASVGGLDAWRHASGELLMQARQVLVPSRDVARRFQHMWPDARVRVAPHTDVPADGKLPLLPVLPRPADQPLRIVVLGALSRIKGADVLEDVALHAARRGLPLEFHLLGFAYRDLQGDKPARSLLEAPESGPAPTSNASGRARLTVHGAYREQDLPRLLTALQPDLVWFPALWPETYSYTLSGALLAGLPVAASNLGAFPERLSGRPWSWVQAWDSTAAEWAAFFDEIRVTHFVPGKPPSPQWFLAAEAPAAGPAWQYETDYLQGIAAPEPLTQLEPLFALALPPAVAATAPADQAGLKARMLEALVHLRALPVLRPIARAVPMHWQTRVKTWLRA